MKLINLRTIYYLIFISIATGCGDAGKIGLESKTKSVSASAKIVKAELGQPRSLSPDFMCYNVNSTQVVDWRDADFTKAIKNLNSSLLRIPGGDVGNYWNWQRGGLIENTASLPSGLPFFLRFKARKYTAGKLPDFQAALVATDTKPIFVLNMLTADLESQLEMLRTAKDLGMEIKYVELGNEFYFNIPNYKKTFPNPRAYGLAAKTWTDAIKQEFPDVIVSVVGVVPPPDKPPRLQNWNKVMRGTVLPAADAIALHIYHDHGLATRSKQSDYPYFDEREVPLILGEPFRNWQNLRNDSNYQAIPNDKQIWITEYNLLEDIFQNGSDKPIPRVAGSWTHGLYNLATSLLFLEESRIASICNHSLTESSLFGAIFNNSDFINPADTTMKAVPMSLSATGSALSLLGEATQSMTTATPISFDLSTQLNGQDNFNYPAIYGWQFSSSSNKQGIIINLSPQIKEIDLSSLFNSVSYQQLSGSPKDLVNNPEVLIQTSGEGEQTILLPPYSVTRLSQDTQLISD